MLVATPNGAKASSALEVGDYVLASHEARGEIGSYPIAAIWTHEVSVMVELTIDGETISITPKHLFYTPHGWVEAALLSIGETVIKADGSVGIVQAAQVVPLRQLVYNLTVAEAHTYFIGHGHWLVHNGGDDELVRRGTSWESTSRLKRQAEAAERAGFPHGVSVTTPESNARLARNPKDVSRATRSAFQEAGFPVHHTPTRRDRSHHTVELPKPVTKEVAKRFNQVLGRKKR